MIITKLTHKFDALSHQVQWSILEPIVQVSLYF